jgi:tRNA(Ile)-lysidine synthase
MRNLEAVVAKAIRLNGIQTDDKLLLAVSGGIDSVVLSEVIFNLGFTFGIAHCNYSLRGKDSDLDQAFVEKLSQRLNARIFVKKFVKDYVEQLGTGSVQMNARALRYQFFKDLTLEHGYQWIVTAHHLDDQLETTLLNLTRGTGIKGIVGMSAGENGIFRPLLSATRAEIEAYAEANNLAWREDKTNTSDKYARNKIRHKVIPVLRTLNPSLEKTFFLTHDRLAQAEKVVDIWLKSEAEKVIIPTTGGMLACIDLALVKTSHAPGLLLQYLLRNFPFQYPEIRQMLELERETGARFYSGYVVAFVNRGKLEIVEHHTTQTTEYQIEQLPVSISAAHFTLVGKQVPVPPETAWKSHIWMDADALQFPLKLRPWQPGDVFLPFGLKGRKKVSDLLVDAKVSLADKPKVMVLESDGEIAWVLGHRLDQRFALNRHSRQAVKWTFSPQVQ